MAGCSEWVAAKRKGQFGLSRSSALERGELPVGLATSLLEGLLNHPQWAKD